MSTPIIPAPADFRECNGIVIMLDALGVRSHSQLAAKDFVNNVREFINDLSRFHASEKDLYSAMSSTPEIVVFGDTLIYTWDLQATPYKNALLASVAKWLQHVVLAGINRRLLWRGAMAMGEYLWSPTMVLGPAVADAASWCEAADWIGIVATPNCGHHLGELRETCHVKGKHEVAELFDRGYLEYDVPVAGNRTHKLWVVNWPHVFTLSNDPHVSALRLFHGQLESFSIPKGVESKYANTEKFFNFALAARGKVSAISPLGPQRGRGPRAGV